MKKERKKENSRRAIVADVAETVQDDFAKRAAMASRNNSDRASGASGDSWRRDDSRKDKNSDSSKHK
jgi:hypothetical protein